MPKQQPNGTPGKKPPAPSVKVRMARMLGKLMRPIAGLLGDDAAGRRPKSLPDNMPQAITVTDAQGRWAVYVPLRVGGKIVVPESLAH
jgi:hypothetical protein